MFRNLKPIYLYIIFGLLALGAVAMLVIDNLSGKSNFKTDLVEVPAAELNKISILRKGEKQPVELLKTDSTWTVTENGETFEADPSAVNALLSEIDLLKVERVAGTKKAQWNKYFLEDTSVISVKFYKDKELETEIFIGKFEYSQPQNMQQAYTQQPQFKLTTYVRTDDEETMYAVNGMLNFTFNKTAADFRNRTITQVPLETIDKVTVNYKERAFLLEKRESNWFIGNNQTDSTAVTEFFGIFADLKSSDFTQVPPATEPLSGTISFEGEKLGNPIQLKLYGNKESGRAILTTTQNKGVAFDALKNDLLSRIFVEGDSLLKK